VIEALDWRLVREQLTTLHDMCCRVTWGVDLPGILCRLYWHHAVHLKLLLLHNATLIFYMNSLNFAVLLLGLRVRNSSFHVFVEFSLLSLLELRYITNMPRYRTNAIVKVH
jgi:hypothetical protein